jgi:hypothetical protein
MKLVKRSQVFLGGRYQYGGFATCTIRAGCTVIAMDPTKLQRFAATHWEKRDPSLPHDGAIFIEVAGCKYVTDWGDGGQPLWYNLNHSRAKPNLRMVYTRRGVSWISLRRISRDEELLFDYGDVPDEWD